MEYIIKDKIDELISKSIIESNNETDETAREKSRIILELYRAIKTEFKKIEGRTGKEITPVEELNILLGMKTQRVESSNIYKNASRADLAYKEDIEAEVLSNILPALPTEDDIKNYTVEIIETNYGGKCEMRNMRDILAEVKKKYPSAEGGLVSSIVKQYTAK